MSAASSSCQGGYDVFLNFRGEDTRNGFTAHLYEALCNKEIQTFLDADNIVKGEEISPALIRAIDKSMFCVVVLSKNYASSTWCLDELVQILKCKRDKKQTVLPIFYSVNPSDVREQKGSFAKALAKHEEKFKEKGRMQIWKQALTEVANISGWDARNRHEPTLIKEIIEHISSKLINRSSKDAKAMIGVDSHISASDLLYENESGKRSIDDFSIEKEFESEKAWEVCEDDFSIKKAWEVCEDDFRRENEESESKKVWKVCELTWVNNHLTHVLLVPIKDGICLNEDDPRVIGSNKGRDLFVHGG